MAENQGGVRALDLHQSAGAAIWKTRPAKIWRSTMAWNATHILWDEQVMLLWITLPPVFLAAAFLPFAARLLFDRREKNRRAKRNPTAQVAVERV
jgi:hypothetical protein